MTVEAGKRYRIRMINAGSLLFYTVCFDKHNVTIIAADAYPTNPLPVTCVDINLGQRCVKCHRASIWQQGLLSTGHAMCDCGVHNDTRNAPKW